MANGICGKSFLLKNSTLDTFAMAKSNDMVVNNNLVDSTAKDTNGWAEYLSDCGISSLTVSMSGIYTDESYEKTLAADAFAKNSKEYTIIDGYGNTVVCDFIVQSYTVTGNHDGATEFSVTLQSSGVPVYTPAP